MAMFNSFLYVYQRVFTSSAEQESAKMEFEPADIQQIQTMMTFLRSRTWQPMPHRMVQLVTLWKFIELMAERIRELIMIS
jgi:hypothetical protein